MALSFLPRLFRFRSQNARRRQSPPPVRLRLELLENRLVPSTLRVGSSEPFHTIQSAVNAAHAGDTVLVDPGTYQEQVIIPAADTGLTLRSVRPLAAVLQAPAVMTGNKAIVDDAGAHNVTIDGFTITGPGGNSSGSINYGIRVDSGGSANILNNHITKIQDNPFSSAQNGVAIQVGRQVEGTTGSAYIFHNVIDSYQKGGIVVSNVGSSATIEGNTVQGVGPTAVIAQNGIQISEGATATLSRNSVSGNVYTPQTAAATGILLLNPGAVTADHNTVTHNDIGIIAIGATGTVIDHNEASDNTFIGIALMNTTGAQVNRNTTNNNGTSQPGGGIVLIGSSNNTLDHNESSNNHGVGILLDATSTQNTVKQNRMKGNSVIDAEDDSSGSGTAGTANTWDHNQCDTDNRGGGLCR